MLICLKKKWCPMTPLKTLWNNIDSILYHKQLRWQPQRSCLFFINIGIKRLLPTYLLLLNLLVFSTPHAYSYENKGNIQKKLLVSDKRFLRAEAFSSNPQFKLYRITRGSLHPDTWWYSYNFQFIVNNQRCSIGCFLRWMLTFK